MRNFPLNAQKSHFLLTPLKSEKWIDILNIFKKTAVFRILNKDSLSYFGSPKPFNFLFPLPCRIPGRGAAICRLAGVGSRSGR